MALNENQLNRRFEDQAARYIDQLFRLAYARVGNIQDAEDIVQETYMRAYRSFDSFREGSNMKAWLSQILINISRDWQRKKGRTLSTVELEEAFAQDEEPLFASPEDQLCDNEFDAELAKALMSLSEVLAMPFLLREVYDASYEEIATILSIPTGTVMSRLCRARLALRNKLISKPGK